ncbi:MAG: hypothetical protein IJE43_19455 [Alphaproteobacteria bacterium]|nr:hypothetical protein [Alphaproteobacteria bacterium]
MCETTVQQLQQNIDSCRDTLLKNMIQADERARIGKANEEKAASIDEELSNYIKAKENLIAAMNHLTSIYKNISHYAEERKKLALDALKLAISKAGYIVPDADIEGIQLEVNDKTACVVDKDGLDINLEEGSAYRTVMGQLMDYTLIKEHPNALQVMFLDESFGTLSDETINLMREYLDVFKEDMLIVGIEQHDVLYQGLSAKRYHAVKGKDGITTVLQE